MNLVNTRTQQSYVMNASENARRHSNPKKADGVLMHKKSTYWYIRYWYKHAIRIIQLFTRRRIININSSFGNLSAERIYRVVNQSGWIGVYSCCVCLHSCYEFVFAIPSVAQIRGIIIIGWSIPSSHCDTSLAIISRGGFTTCFLPPSTRVESLQAYNTDAITGALGSWCLLIMKMSLLNPLH